MIHLNTGRDDIVEKSLGAVNAQLKRMTSEKEEIAKRADSLSAELASAKNECSVLAKRLEEDEIAHDQDWEAISLKLSAKESAEEELRTEKAKLGASIAILQDELETIQKKEMEQYEQITQLNQQVEDANFALEKSEAACSEMEDEGKRLAEQIDQLNSQINVATSKITDLEETVEDRESRIDTLSSQLAEVESEKDTAVTKIGGLSDELKSTATTLADVQGLIGSDQRQAEEWKREIKDLVIEKRVLEETVRSIKRDRDDIESKLEFARQEAEDFRLEVESNKALAEDMTRQCEKIAMDKDDLDCKLLVSRQDNQVLKDKLESSETLAESITNQLEILESNSEELGKKSDDAEACSEVLRLENKRINMRCKRQEETTQCLEKILESLKKEYEAFKVEARAATAAQMRLCEAKLEPICMACVTEAHHQKQGRTYDDMIIIIQTELSTLLEKAKSLAKDLESSKDESAILEQQVLILSKEVSKYKLQNKGMLQAFDEITNSKTGSVDGSIPEDERAVDREVEKRLTSFRHNIEMQTNSSVSGSVGMNAEGVEVSLL